nr:AMP-binding protein [Micromonospora sp. DSM 115978]
MLRAGAAYVPVDPDYPRERVAAILQDAAPALLVTDTANAGHFVDAADVVGVLVLDAAGTRVALAAAGGSAPVLSRAVSGWDAAYVIFTSGTTGRPKGVAVSHRAIVNRLVWMGEVYGVGVGDRVLQKTPDGFDVSVWEFFLPLVSGGVVVVARDGGHRDPGYLAEVVERQAVTVAHFVPSMLAAFLAS